MKVILIIIFFLSNCSANKEVIYDYKYAQFITNRIYEVRTTNQIPTTQLCDSILNTFKKCPNYMAQILIAFHRNLKKYMDISLQDTNYFKLNYDTIANLFLKYYFQDANIGNRDFNISYLIRSKTLIPIYYKYLDNKTPLWGILQYPTDYFYDFAEQPYPLRICDAALDGIVYSKYPSKITFYQQFFFKRFFRFI
jgi:hypothetical protein